MQGTINQVAKFLEQGFVAIVKFLQLIWTWSFGQIVSIFQSNWQSLPAWKIIVLVLVIGGIVYLLYRSAQDLWAALQDVFRAFVSLLGAFVAVMPFVLGAGILAFAGGWVIQNINF